MALLSIVTAPDPRLKRTSSPVETVDDAVRRLADDMLETMYAAPGIGLAAIQVDIPKRMLVADVSREDDVPRDPHVLINPEIVWRSDEMSLYEEGCLSIPEYYEEVERPNAVKVNYLDIDGKPQEIEASGLLSTCLQHEIDHINGVLFIDHISRLKREMVMKKFRKAQKRGEPVKPLSEDKVPSHHIG